MRLPLVSRTDQRAVPFNGAGRRPARGLDRL